MLVECINNSPPRSGYINLTLRGIYEVASDLGMMYRLVRDDRHQDAHYFKDRFRKVGQGSGTVQRAAQKRTPRALPRLQLLLLL